MLTAWVVLLGAAAAMTLADWPVPARDSGNRDLPPAP
jgi:hypothetical protein